MSRKISLQKEQLIKLSQAYTDAEIAKMYNVSEGTIIYYRNKWEILRMPRKRKRKMPSDEKLRELYETCTPAEIAGMYGCARTTVYNNLLRLGLSRYYRLPTDNEFKELYFKYSRKELAAMYNVHVMTIDYRAKQLGIYRDEQHPKLQGGPPSKCPDKETLLNLLDKYSIKEIANMYDVSSARILEWSEKYGIYRNNLVAPTKEEFTELYKKHTIPELMKICGLSKSGIEHRMRKYGLSRKQYPLSRPQVNNKKSTGCRGKVRQALPKELLEESLKTLSAKETAEKHNVSLGSIYRLAHQYDLEIKNHGKKRGRPRKTRLDTNEN